MVALRYEVRVKGTLSERARGAFRALDGSAVPSSTPRLPGRGRPRCSGSAACVLQQGQWQ
jgi:hypothetical protein